MKCCIDCFKDQELKAIIRSNSTELGKCDYCKSKDVPLVNPHSFDDMFMQLSQSYESVENQNIDGSHPHMFHEKIQKDWGLFSEQLIRKKNHQKLVQDILGDLLDEKDALFTDEVEQKVITRNLENTHTLKKWDDFTEEIKRNNRYFLGEEIDLELLEDLFNHHSKNYRKGKRFYRARVSEEKEGYKIDKMGKPPSKQASSGRANPVGIPYLYVSTDRETVIHECRASFLDYLTIAEFKLKERLKVVSLRRVENISPFAIGDGLDNYLKNKKYLKTLESELSKPLKRQDQKLDYLPTQYICEYIKSLGYDAIEYGSSLVEGGINLAIFQDEKLEPLKTEVHEVTSMDLQTELINKQPS